MEWNIYFLALLGYDWIQGILTMTQRPTLKIVVLGIEPNSNLLSIKEGLHRYVYMAERNVCLDTRVRLLDLASTIGCLTKVFIDKHANKAQI
jgi:hypothetical protein